MHAYIVEDDYLIGRSIQDMLGDLGFTQFSFARSEDAAILGAASEQYDLVTVDVRLLPGDGVKAAEEILARRGAPLIFITGYAEELQDRIAEAMPGVPIVQKPIKPEALAAAVRRVLPPIPEPSQPT